MGEGLSPAPEEAPEDGSQSQKVEDIDKAQEMAEAEAPIREKIQTLVALGVSKGAIKKEFSQESIDAVAEKAARVYTEAKRLVDGILIRAVKEPGVEYGSLGLDTKVVEILKRQVFGDKRFIVKENNKDGFKNSIVYKDF